MDEVITLVVEAGPWARFEVAGQRRPSSRLYGVKRSARGVSDVSEQVGIHDFSVGNAIAGTGEPTAIADAGMLL